MQCLTKWVVLFFYFLQKKTEKLRLLPGWPTDWAPGRFAAVLGILGVKRRERRAPFGCQPVSVPWRLKICATGQRLTPTLPLVLADGLLADDPHEVPDFIVNITWLADCLRNFLAQ